MAIEINCDPLPCAAIQEDIDDYIANLDKVYSGKIYQSLHRKNSGKYLLTSSCIDSNFNVGVVSKYDSLNSLQTGKIMLYLNPRFGPCCSQSAYLTSSDLLLTGFDCGTIALIEGEFLSLAETRMVFHNNVTSLKLSPDQNTCVGGDLGSRIAVLDLDAFRVVQYYEPAHASKITDLAYHPQDGRIFISAGDNDLVLWDTRSKIPAAKLLTTTTAPTCVIFPEIDRIFLGTEGGNIVDFDLKAKIARKIEVISDHESVRKLEMIPNIKNSSKINIAVIPDRNIKEGSIVKLLNFDLELIKDWNFPGRRINSLFYDQERHFVLGEKRFFNEISL